MQLLYKCLIYNFLSFLFRPPATLVKPKKKRRKGYDSGDELNALDVLPSTPPPIEDESLVEVIV